MKKILVAIFATLVTAAWVLPAMAVDTTFYGTYRVRAFSTSNNWDYASGDKQKTYTGTGSTTTEGAVNTDENSWIDQRFRLGVETKASDNLRGFVQLEIGNAPGGVNRSHVWGTAVGTAASWGSVATEHNQNVFARQAYLSFNAGPVRIKAGRQVFGDAVDGGQSFRVADDNVYYGLVDGGLVLVSQLDAFILTTKALEPVTLYFGYAKIVEGSATGSAAANRQDRDDTLYILQATMAPSDTLNGGVYFLYDSDRTLISSITGGGERNPYWIGVGVDAKLDPINLKAHAAYKGGTMKGGCQATSGTTSGVGVQNCGLTGTDKGDLSYTAYALDVDASMKIDQITVGVAAGLGTGDDSVTDKNANNFTGVAGAYGVQLGQRPAIFFDGGEVSNGGAALNVANSTGANGLDQSTLGNITFAELYASFKASDELTLNGLAAYFMNTTTKRTTGTSTSTTWDGALGTEVDLNAVYKLYKELALSAQAAWFMPGNGILKSKDQAGNYMGIENNDTVSEYFAKVQYDF